MEAQSWTYTNRQTGETVPMQVKVTCTGVNKDCPCDREHIGHQAKIYFTDEAGAPRIWLKGMLEELDRAAKELNISRQAVIKTLIRQALDQQYLARGNRTSVKRK